MRTYYLLTIDGKPAQQREDGFMFFVGRRDYATTFATLQQAKRAIARAQKADEEFSKTCSWSRDFAYGYCLIRCRET